MWLFYGYKFLLPVLIAIISLFIFITWREDRVHHGWWLAFLFFSLSLALAIPVKANPFQNNLNNYEESKKIVQQINGLYWGSSCKRTKKDHRMIQLKHKTAIIPTVLCFSSKQIRIIPIINCTKKDHRISKDEHS